MREHRVIGPPGTGKTTYLQRQFVIASNTHTQASLFALSLTRAAATELSSRVKDVPERNVGTLHSHAYRALKYPNIVETTPGLKDWNEYCGSRSYRIGTQHAANPENAPSEPLGPDSNGVKLMQDMGVLRQRMVRRELWPVGVQAFAKRWDEFKRETNRFDFTDLIEISLQNIDALPGCEVLFADEAQDMSKLEFALVRKWGRKVDELIVVGDPDQNLYEWRGSDPQAFYSVDAASERILSQSYRVPKAVHHAAVKWIAQVTDRHDAPYDPTPSEGRLTYAKYQYKHPNALIQEAIALTSEGESVMILASCGYMLYPLIARMKELGITFHNPYRTSFYPWNPVRQSKRLLSFLRPDRATWADQSRLWTWAELHDWVEVLQANGTLARGFKSLIESRLAEDRFGDSEAEKLVELEKVLANVKEEHHEQLMELDYEWWYSRLRHNDKKSQSFALTVARHHGASRLREPIRIIVGTIHSVKGGEADHVFLFPDLSNQGYLAWKRHGRPRNAVVRQFYVGMTRARQSLTLCTDSGQTCVKWL